MSKQLDRNRYFAQVYGDDRRKFYQDGIYFDGGGNAINSGREATPPEPEEESGVTEEAPAQDTEAVDKLNAMNVAQLKKVAKQVAEATGTEPERWTGAGIADVLREYILSHTE